MQTPPNPPSMTERVSRHVLVLLRLLFFLLIFYLLFSIAAGLLMPGDVVGRYTVLTEPSESCEALETRLEEFNVNNVSYRVVPAELSELASEVNDGNLCWLEIRGVPERGVGDAAAPLYDAAMRKTDGPLDMDRAYQPRFGQVESLAIWLLSLLLALLVVFGRSRRSS